MLIKTLILCFATVFWHETLSTSCLCLETWSCSSAPQRCCCGGFAWLSLLLSPLHFLPSQAVPRKASHRTVPFPLRATSEEPGRYGNIMKAFTKGASCLTAKLNNLTFCGIYASEKLAKDDLEKMNKYKKQLKEIGRKFQIDPSVIAGIISRETRAGAILNEGWGERDNTFGLMQIYKENHTSSESWDSTEHISQGTQILIDMIESIERMFPKWKREDQVKGGIAAFNAGPSHIKNYSEIDDNTSNKDYANDVIARAKYFKSHGF